MIYLLTTIYAIAFLFSIEGMIKKSPQGNALIEGIASGTIRFMNWRAASDAKKSLLGLSNIFKWTIIFSLIFFALFNRILSKEILSIYSNVTVFTIFAWISFNWFFDYKKELLKLVTPGILITLSPWLFILIASITDFSLNMPIDFSKLSAALGFDFSNKYILAAIFSIVSLLSFLLLAVTLLTVFLIPSTIIFFALWLTSKVFGHWTKHKPIWIHNVLILYLTIMTIYLFYISLNPILNPTITL